jgi:hypothetical protein
MLPTTRWPASWARWGCSEFLGSRIFAPRKESATYAGHLSCEFAISWRIASLPVPELTAYALCLSRVGSASWSGGGVRGFDESSCGSSVGQQEPPLAAAAV